ncbi:GPI mannosyltransferase [Dirofilaria immitis]
MVAVLCHYWALFFCVFRISGCFVISHCREINFLYFFSTDIIFILEMVVRTEREKRKDASTPTPNFKDRHAHSDSLKEYGWDAECALFVLKQCIISRALIFVIQFVMNLAVTDYPTDAFQGVPIPQVELSQIDRWIRIAFNGLTRWDAVHFLHIAQYGYTYENNLAFFPFFPTLIYFFTLIWSWAVPFIHFSTAIVLTALTVNFIAFILCGQLLYALLLILTKSTKLALLACLVFTLNPASIFFSAVYSEGVYMLLTFCGMFALYADPSLPFIRYVIAALFFSLAFATRSNGVFNFGYIMFQLTIETVYSMTLRKFIWECDCGTVLLKLFRFIMVITICWGIFGSQIVSHDSKMHRNFCSQNITQRKAKLIPDVVHQYASQNGLILPHDLGNLTWCRQERNILLIPSFYKHVQEKYWQVEPFGYWQLKKLPCFMLAAPVIFIVLYGSLFEFNRLKIMHGSLFGVILGILHNASSIFPFMIHALLLTVLALVLYNVEVLTRILFSSSPFVYLVIAQYMDRRTPLVTLDDVQYPTFLPFFTNFSRSHWIHALLLCYLLGYFYIGTLLHANWLPFT